MFRFLAAFLTLCVVAVLAAPFVYRTVGADHRAERLLQSGQQNAESGNWVAARLRFEQVLSKDPDNLEARLDLARALRQGGLYEYAATHLLDIIDRAPEMAAARIEFGEMLFFAGQIEESQVHLKAARDVGDRSARADALAAALATTRNEDDLARDLADAALASNPGLSSAYATLAALALRDQDLDRAIAILDRAREAGAETLSLGLLRLGVYEKVGRLDEVGPELTDLGARFPDVPELRIALARWLIGETPRNEESARVILADLLRQNADDQAMVGHLTSEMVDMLGVDGVLGVFAAVASDPRFEGAFENQIAILEMADGDRPSAIARLEREIANTDRAGTPDASRLILGRLLDPVDGLDRRRELALAVIADDPDNSSARLLLADVDMRGGDFDRAISHLRAALSVESDNTDIIIALARAHALAGSTELAQDLLAKAVQVSGQSPRIVLRYARLIEARQGARAAASLVDIAIEVHPDDRDLLVQRAKLALADGDAATASSIRARLDGLDTPPGVVAALELAISAQSGGMDTALATLQENWTESRDETDLLSLGAAYLRAGQSESALELLGEVLLDKPGWGAARLMRADALMAAGKFEDAEKDLSAAAQIMPGDPKIHANLARLRMALDRPDAADAAITQGLAENPGDYELAVLHARRLELTGDVAAALTEFRHLSRREPADPRVAARLGQLLVEESDSPEDLSYAARITAPFDTSSDPKQREIRGWVLHRNGDSVRAASLLRDVAVEHPEDAVLQARLGLVQLGAGYTNAARETLLRAQALAETTHPDPRLRARVETALKSIDSAADHAEVAR